MKNRSFFENFNESLNIKITPLERFKLFFIKKQETIDPISGLTLVTKTINDKIYIIRSYYN